MYEYEDQFESIEEIFNSKRQEMLDKGIPTVQRKYIMR
jgi:hypothetical protein